ncbi:MAG: ABC transporter permease [Ignavibacteriae bacterium]|nr:ABC transporter permease [Ignavibacteria bacterium]MBI3363676.1 ABC transporter permease [Ignavibacteriota bacterium]
MLESILNIAFLAQSLRISIPYALPALGATFSERGGVVNIALEGILLISAFATTVGVFYTESVLVGILCGISAGILTALFHSIVSVTFKADQIVSGIGINLFALGITKFFCQLIFNSSSNSARIVGLEQWTFLPALPILGNPFLFCTLFLLLISHFTLFRTRFGLRLRAVGEHPEAADTLGISVDKMRHIGVLLSGAFTGLAGAWLALDQHSFTDGMAAGRGFIALAAMIIGKWTPIGAVAASLLFGFAESLSLVLQEQSNVAQLIQMIPYLLTMIILCGFIGRATAPAADGIPYEKESA